MRNHNCLYQSNMFYSVVNTHHQKTTHNVTYNMYWSQHTLWNEYIFVQTSQGTLTHKILWSRGVESPPKPIICTSIVTIDINVLASNWIITKPIPTSFRENSRLLAPRVGLFTGLLLVASVEGIHVPEVLKFDPVKPPALQLIVLCFPFFCSQPTQDPLYSFGFHYELILTE